MINIDPGSAGLVDHNFEYGIIYSGKLTYSVNLSILEGVMDKPKIRFVKADICDREAVYKVFKRAQQHFYILTLQNFKSRHSNYVYWLERRDFFFSCSRYTLSLNYFHHHLMYTRQFP